MEKPLVSVWEMDGALVVYDAKSTAGWIRQMLAGEQPVPEPLVQQLACCCYAAGRTGDFDQALELVRRLVRPGSASALVQ